MNEIQISETINFDISEVEQKFDYYNQNKININEAQINDLVQLPLIDIRISKSLIRNKPYKSTSALNNQILKVNGHRIIRFILASCLTTKKEPNELFNMNYRVRNKTVANKINGIENKNFNGSELDLYQRFDATYDNFSVNAVVDKDIGERSITDFASISGLYNSENLKIILGDYNVSFGLGDMFDMGFINTKNANFSNTAQSYGYGFAVNRSTIENNFLRGTAIEFNQKIYKSLNIKARGFYSTKQRPANIDADDFISSIYSSGYFRSDNEISKKINLSEEIIGANIELSNDKFGLGTSASHIKYSKPILTSSFATFNGQKGLLKNLYGYYLHNNITLMSEIVLDADNNTSFRINFSETSQNTEYLIEFRKSDSEFRLPFANNFGEQSFLGNESGLITGVKFNDENIDISLFSDIYQSEVKTFQLSKPLKGVELFSLFEFDINGINFNVRLTQEIRSDRLTIEGIDGKLTFPSNRSRIRLEVRDYLGNGLDIKSRLEIISYQNEYEQDRYGYLTFFGLRKKFDDFQIGGRYTIFNTDDFDTAIYTYQYMTPGLSYVYAFYNKGSHFNSYLKYEFIDNIDFTIRLDYLYKNNEDSIGSGLMEIDNNSRTNLFFQLDYSFN